MTGLLERDDAESALHRALAGARSGRGGVVLVAGEAGIGKTSLVRAFVSRAAGRPRVLVGACDPIDTPRPLGALIDAATGADPGLATRLATGLPRAEAFASALGLLDPGDDDAAVVLVLEDLHWADDATLDLFTFLGRRLDERRALLVATFRSDEVDVRHPLRVRLADVHHHVRARVELRPLGVDAVRRLAIDAARGDIDADGLHRRTGGNPFFVTEALASGGEDVPESVRDAVLARASRMPTDARAVLDAAAISPGNVEPWLLADIVDDPAIDVRAGLDTCESLGLLRRRGDGDLEFRHELARLAVEDVIDPTRRRRLHERALSALQRHHGPPDHARLAHHAIRADAGSAVLRHAPLAATESLHMGGANASADLLGAALRYVHLVDDRRRGELFRAHASALTVAARYAEAVDSLERALSAFEAVGDHLVCAEVLADFGDPLWGLARQPEFLDRLRQADEMLGADPAPSRAAACVAEAWCGAHMLARQPGPAELSGERAMRIAAQIDASDISASAAIARGISRCMSGDDSGLDMVREGMRLAGELGLDEQVARGYSQIGSGYGELRRYDIAMPALRDGIAFQDEREYVSRQLYDRAWLARCELEVGEWNAATERAGAVVRDPRCTGNTRLVALCTLAWLRSRRGDPGVEELLDEALELARTAQHIQRLWPVVVCRAEHTWLHDRLADEIDLVLETHALADRLDYRPAAEELAHWLTLAGTPPTSDVSQPRSPFGLSAAGNWDLALDRWLELGCPYEAAFCRYLLDTPDQVRSAHQTFTELGAIPMRDRAAERLRELGERVPRGANRSTRENPFGLTAREVDVLLLLPTGSTNAEIGEQLHISTKTAGHHVSSILTKLGVSNRAEAAALAERSGLTDPR